MTMMHMNKPCFAIYIPKFIIFSSTETCPADFGLEPLLFFIPYLAFYNFDLSNVSCV